MKRREFLGSIVYPAGALAMLQSGALTAGCVSARRGVLGELASHRADPHDIARDERYWSLVGEAFTMDRSIINLNNGGVSPAPRFVQESYIEHFRYANRVPPPVSLWQEQQPQRESVRRQLARQWRVDAEEIAITRNSSESLQICQFGFDLQPGDEVLTTTQDYPRMVNTFRQRARRDGVVFRQFKIPIPSEDPAQVVRLFEENISARTRLILMSHMINITGQILPVRDVVRMARSHNGGIPVIVDGAHALAHFEFSIPDLECDYYASSLHKWLFAPHGTGLLFVRKDRIKPLWPLMAASPEQDENIRKFEEVGTHPEAPALAIAEALHFHNAIGPANKEARLRYLRDYWVGRLRSAHAGRIRMHTSLRPEFSCGIANAQVDGLDSVKLAEHLWKGRDILTVAIKHDEFEGIRVSPSVYTTLDELDRFCDKVDRAIREGFPAA